MKEQQTTVKRLRIKKITEGYLTHFYLLVPVTLITKVAPGTKVNRRALKIQLKDTANKIAISTQNNFQEFLDRLLTPPKKDTTKPKVKRTKKHKRRAKK